MLFAILTIFNNGFIWAVGIIVTLIWGEDKQFRIESLDVWVIAAKMLGFFVTAVGILLYNKMIFNK